MTDDRQRLRREAVDAAGGYPPGIWVTRVILAMESLLVEAEAELDCTDGHLLDQVKDADGWQARAEAAEKSLATCRDYIEKAEATIAKQAKELERLRALWYRDNAPDEVKETADD